MCNIHIEPSVLIWLLFVEVPSLHDLAVLSLLDVSSPEAVVPISTADQTLKIPVFRRRSATLARVND